MNKKVWWIKKSVLYLHSQLRDKRSLKYFKKGGLPEWLMEQFAKLSTRKGRKGSNPLPSAFET